MALVIKDPDASVDYAIDWSADYLEDQAIFASSWQVAPSEAGGVVVEAASNNFLRTAVRIGGGAAGRVYQLTNRVELSDGQSDERSITIRVDAR
jgi:hypothetical protein